MINCTLGCTNSKQNDRTGTISNTNELSMEKVRQSCFFSDLGTVYSLYVCDLRLHALTESLK